MYTLKTIARRGTALGMAASLLVAAILPGASAFADALNPLTERSLLLSSSSPGYAFTDGSGNSEGNLNAVDEYYSPPGSGPNGQKTGETFTFTMSSTDDISGISLQYCTTAAGNCQSPGDNSGDYNPTDDTDPAYAGEDSTREDNATAHPLGRSDLEVVGEFIADEDGTVALFNPEDGTGGGNFTVYQDDGGNGVFAPTTGWSMDAINAEDTTFVGEDGDPTTIDDPLTGKFNYIRLVNTGQTSIDGGDQIKIVFNPSDDIYITNPGSGSFFVKINTYSTNDPDLFTSEIALEDNNNVVDGGVTVANVMTDSIHITTKVLETMSFSVGLENRDTYDLDGTDTHGTCDPIQVVDNNRLNLGNPDAEYSLETGRAWDVYSYWRLSSNSSGGATVYYSGDTLRNTVGDFIEESGATAATSLPGTEQFGLAFVDATADDLDLFAAAVDGTQDFFDDNDSNGVVSPGDAGVVATDPDDFRLPKLHTLVGVTAYNGGTGTIDNGNGGQGTAAFAFESASLTVPELIASNNTSVITCDTAKMRYVGNIGADTPAGVYTTKINYLAAPQY